MRRYSPRERAVLLMDGYCGLPEGVRPNGSKPKKGWASKAAAKRAMKETNKQMRASGKVALTHVYLCRCGLWHATSA